MEDSFSKIDQRISQLKQKKEKMKISQALLLFKETQNILGEKFSFELVLSVLSHSWKSASPKQKEEWINSASSFRVPSEKDKSKKLPRSPETYPQTSTENL